MCVWGARQLGANVTRACWAKLRTRQIHLPWHLGGGAPTHPPTFLPWLPPSAPLSLLALTFLRLGVRLGCVSCFVFLIKAQCRSSIYSAGGKAPLPLQPVPAFHPKGQLGRGVWLCGQGTFCSGTSLKGTVVPMSKWLATARGKSPVSLSRQLRAL